MEIKKELAAFKTLIELNEKTLGHIDSKGPLGFVDRLYPIRLGARLIACFSYPHLRLVSGDSPERIATRNATILRIYTDVQSTNK